MIARCTSPYAALLVYCLSPTFTLQYYRAFVALATWFTRHKGDAVRVTGAVRLLRRPPPNQFSFHLHLPQTHQIEPFLMGQLTQPSIRRKTRTAYPRTHQTPPFDAIPASSQKGCGVLARLWAKFTHAMPGKRFGQCLELSLCVHHSLRSS